jgi:hypothetical protein
VRDREDVPAAVIQRLERAVRLRCDMDEIAGGTLDGVPLKRHLTSTG